MTCARRQLGFTILEMMIVVGILAVLSAIALISFGRWKARSVKAEAAAVLANISLRQESYRAEFASYMNCPTAQQWWPNLNSGGEPTKKDVGTTNTCWTSLGLTTDRYLYCAYSVYGGAASTWSANYRSEDQGAFPGSTTPPATLWYVGIAECDLDGNQTGQGTNSVFYRTNVSTSLGERNPDK